MTSSNDYLVVKLILKGAERMSRDYMNRTPRDLLDSDSVTGHNMSDKGLDNLYEKLTPAAITCQNLISLQQPLKQLSKDTCIFILQIFL